MGHGVAMVVENVREDDDRNADTDVIVKAGVTVTGAAYDDSEEDGA